MQTEDKYLVVSIILAVLVGSIFVFLRIPGHSVFRQTSGGQSAAVEALPVNVTRATLLGQIYKQDKSCQRPYVIVEFGDYQCPPCADMHTRLKKFVEANSNLVGLAFHHYPLVEIHPSAFSAALYAEAAREQGKFWQMHDLLYTGTDGLTSSGMEQYAQQLHLNIGALHRSMETTAKMRVRADQDAAFNLNLESTPTLILCGPNAKPRIVTFDELEKSIR